jgi:hypothetical protein
VLIVVGAGWLGGLGGCFRKKLAESWFIAFGVGVIGEDLGVSTRVAAKACWAACVKSADHLAISAVVMECWRIGGA